MASFAAGQYGSKTAFIYNSGNRTEIRLFSTDGMPFSREDLRNLSEKTPKETEINGNVYLLPHGVLIKKYITHLRTNSLIPKKISLLQGYENKYLREICDELGIITQSDERFGISADGTKAYVQFNNGAEIPFWRLLAICCIGEKKNEITLPRDTPDMVEKILNRHGVKTLFYGDSKCENRNKAKNEFLHRDGIILALTAAALAEIRNMTLCEFAESVPPFSIKSRNIYADKEKMGSVISQLRKENSSNRNAGFDFGEGRVNVFPSASGQFRLVAEATDSETAEEISLRAIDLLGKK